MSDLFDLAVAASKKAHAPYSKFPVGVALKTVDGQIYTGANIENTSFPEGWCAETTAISHMIMDGQTEIAEVTVYAPKLDEITPCGGCRQRLAEFGSPTTKINLCDQAGVTRTINMADLLPNAFDQESYD